MRISGRLSAVLIVVDQKLLETVACFRCVGSVIPNDVTCTWGVKLRIDIAKTAFSNKKPLFTSNLDIYLRNKSVR